MSYYWKGLLPLIVAALLGGVLFTLSGKRPSITASRGTLDLSHHDFTRDGPVRVQGEWEFYWGCLLSPDDFLPGKPAPSPTGYLSLPGTWRGYRLDGNPLGGKGQATFRLRLSGGKQGERLALRLVDIQMAYRLWANGRLVAESGKPGIREDLESPHRSLVLAELESMSQPVDLLLQISNHSFRKGGVPESFLLGPQEMIRNYQVRLWGWAIFFVACLLTIGSNYIMLYFWQKKERSYIYFGLYCLLLVGYVSTSNTSNWILMLLIENNNPVLLERFSLACFMLSGFVLYRFFKSLYPDEYSTIMLRISDVKSLGLFVVVVFFPMRIVYYSVVVAFFFSPVFIPYYIVRLFACLKNGRSGAFFLLVGASFLAVAAFNDILSHIGVIHTPYVIKLGLFVFALSQAVSLGQRFSKTFILVENLSNTLKRQNVTLQEEISERSRLEREVVRISEEERRRISHELHDGLCQKLTSARLWCSTLTQKPTPGSARENLARLLRESADDAYRISRGLWPVEPDSSVPGPSLDELARSVAKTSGIAIVFHQSLSCKKCTNPHATPLYRIAQEALANAAKHSKATRIVVSLRCVKTEGFILTVQDNGIGRNAARSRDGGLGLTIMAHRAKIIGADLRIADAPQGGTIVRCNASCTLSSGTQAGFGQEESRDNGQ